jgi:hypothetical protein
MIIPPLYGSLEQQECFVYVASDTTYFNDFGKSIINSIKQNSQLGIHIHLYNPTEYQLKYCESQERVTFTFEIAPIELFKEAADKWDLPIANQQNLRRILTAMSKSNDVSIQERIQRTYFASARFIRLAQLISPNNCVFAIDIDAVVRSEIPRLSADKDFYIHHIAGKRARFLAGGIYLPGSIQGFNFLTEYATALKENSVNDELYWGIDQDVLDNIVPKYNFENLPLSYIDWEMNPNSYIWTAKGKRKELEIFINEQKKYNS